MPGSVQYRSYAKINLYLDVLRRRRDNYHNIETIFQTVSLFDELEFIEQPSRLTLECNVAELNSLDSNLVYRAAVMLKQETGSPLGAHIRLEKKIPIAAGMAGGSGNGAAALVALNELWELRLPLVKLKQMALRLGSDVPYCMIGGTAAATRRGEELSPLPPMQETWFVLLHPDVAVSASRVYNSPQLQLSDEKPFAGRTKTLRNAIACLDKGDMKSLVFNRMESAVFSTLPDLARAKERLLTLGCTAAAMSGSGPTVFGVCESRRQAVSIADNFLTMKTSVVCAVPMGLERVS